ncbi:MAG: hypothetical protein M2R45_03917 [Verrucomicrobia subdivision 3 bacterium]|nr:hypothetical protein [Limisphaerales bacterium]
MGAQLPRPLKNIFAIEQNVGRGARDQNPSGERLDLRNHSERLHGVYPIAHRRIGDKGKLHKVVENEWLVTFNIPELLVIGLCQHIGSQLKQDDRNYMDGFHANQSKTDLGTNIEMETAANDPKSLVTLEPAKPPRTKPEQAWLNQQRSCDIQLAFKTPRELQASNRLLSATLDAASQRLAERSYV